MLQEPSAEMTSRNIAYFDDVNATTFNSRVSIRLVLFSKWYAQYHGYASVVVCVVGIVSSLFVVAVLTRRHMVNPTNLMLTALAIFDLLTMVSYVPFALHYYCLYGIEPSPSRDTLRWAYFCLFHANFSVTTHSASIWLAVVLSAYRYIYIRSCCSESGPSTVDYTRPATAGYAVAGVIAATLLILVPNFFSLAVEGVPYQSTNETIYVVTNRKWNREIDRNTVNSLNFWVHALVIKLVPCALMSAFGYLLLVQVHRIHKKGADLRTRATLIHDAPNIRARNQEHNRTTAMLIAVIILFQLTELPQGLLALCSGLEPDFFESYYSPLGDIMDIVALVNNSINFTLYCTMSRQFRTTFLQLFFCRHDHKAV